MEHENGQDGATEEALALENAADLLILLLYAPGSSKDFGEPVVGATRLQKLFFLLREGEGPKELVAQAKELGFQAYKMGPFSEQLRDIITELESAGIIRSDLLSYLLSSDSDDRSAEDPDEEERAEVKSSRYSLTPFGNQIGAALWKGLSDDERKGLTEFKGFFNSLTLRKLLIFTYEKFPESTTRSEIRGQLGF